MQPVTVLTHQFDAVGNRTTLSDSQGGNTWFDHDGEGRLTRLMTPAGDTIDLAYDPAGRLEQIAYPTAAGMQVTYDALNGRPGRIAHTSSAATLAQFDYGFDTDGTITSIADSGGTREFTYDETLQLTGGGYASALESYAYDTEGNRTSSHLSSSYTHDMANRLIEDDNACYVYDANGNLETRTARVGMAGCIGDETTYEWDVLNRLLRIDFSDGTFAAYRYDAQGRRIEKDVNAAVTRYVYDDDAILLEFDGGNVLQARYSHGEEIDQPLAMMRGGASYFYHTDHLGSVRLLTDTAGAVANRYNYDAFGNWEATSYETVSNPFGFTARERDAESGLMFYRARYYDPRIGRFISEDPIGCASNDLNLYRYVFNGPTNASDPSGKLTLVENVFVATSVLGVGAAGVATGALPDPTPVIKAGLAGVGAGLAAIFDFISQFLATCKLTGAVSTQSEGIGIIVTCFYDCGVAGTTTQVIILPPGFGPLPDPKGLCPPELKLSGVGK